MRKFILLILMSILSLFLSGCKEEESAIRFKVTENSDVHDIKVIYESPGSWFIPKEYFILTNGNASELTLKCTNAKKLYFDDIIREDPSHVRFGLNEEGKKDPNTLIYFNGLWTVSIVNGNSLKFIFPEMPDLDDESFEIEDELDYVSPMAFVSVNTNKKDEVLQTSIQVLRDYSHKKFE